MYKITNAVLALVILLTSISISPSEAKQNKRNKRQTSINVCDESPENYKAGTLLVTLFDTTDKKMNLAKLADKSFARVRKQSFMTKVKKMVAKNDLESMKLIYEPDMADLKKSRASLNNKKMSKLKRMRKKRKLKFNQLMAESTLSRTLVLETKITKCKQLEKLAKKLLKNRSVQMVMLDYMSKSNTIADGQPNDFYFSNRGQFAFNYQEGPLWGLKKINTPQVWQDNQGEETIVAVVDSGVDYNHPDIRNNILRDENDNIIGSDFAADDSDPMDVTGHGTQVAGIIAAEGDNNIGMIGVAPRARIMPVRVIGDDGTGSFSDIADGVEFAVNNEADVINLSLGSEVIDSGINRFLARSYPQNVAYRNAINAGVILIKAAGNSSINVNGGVPDGERSQLFDAAVTVPELITVGASTRDDTRAEFSNFGSEQLVDIAAPGGSNTTVNVTPRPDMTPFLDIRFFTNLRQIFDIFPGLSTTKLNILSLACSVCPDTFVHLEGRAESVTVDNSPSYTPSSGGVHSATINLSNIDKVNSDYSTTDGTSFAAPYVAGAAALVRSVVPDLNQADMRELLVNNAQAITTDENIGPRLDIARVFNYLKNLPSPELNSPADSFTTKLNRRPSFEWTRVVGAEYYNLMINETVIRSSETSKTLEQDLTAGSHNWKVQACNSLACGEFSDSRVIVVEEFDIVPEIVSPLSDSILEVSDFIIGWQPIPGASISYSYNVVNVDTGETVANDTVFGAFPRSENLEAGNYELQLQACLGNECSDFARRNFTLIPDIPFAANFTNEIGETTNVQPSFSWESIINAHNYNLTIKRAADEQVIFSTELSETSLSLLIPFKPGSYIAELNTCNDHGCSNTVSQAFTILASERPSQPEFSSFDLIGETQNKNPQTSWRDNINTEFYSIKVIDFNNQEIETATNLFATRYTVKTRLGKGDYSLELRGCNNLGCSSKAVQDFTILPSIPDTPVLEADLSIINRPAITWDNVLDATYYEVSILDTGNFAYQVFEERVESNSFQTENTLADGNYDIFIRACNELGCSSQALTSIEVESFTEVPEIFNPITGSIHDTGVLRFTWEDLGEAVSYEYQINNSNTSRTQTAHMQSSLDTETTVRLENEGEYQFTLRACKQGTCGDFRTISFSILAPDPNTPEFVNLVGDTDERRPSFSWQPVAGANQYNWSIKSLGTNRGAGGITFRTHTTASPSNPLRQGSYVFEVKACFLEDGTLTCSRPATQIFTVTAQDPVPETPRYIRQTVLTHETRTDSHNRFHWWHPFFTDSFTLKITDEETGDIIVDTETRNTLRRSGNSYESFDLKPRDYLVEVAACNINGCSEPITEEFSIEARSEISAEDFEAASLSTHLSNKQDTNAQSDISLSWNDIDRRSQIAYYQVELSDDQGNTVESATLSEVYNTIEYTIQSRLNEGQYFFALKACNDSFGCSEAKVTEINVNINLPGRVIGSFAGFLDTRRPELSWQAATNADYYELSVSREASNDLFEPIRVSSNKYKFDSDLNDGNYKIFIAACNSLGCSDAQDSTIEFTILPDVPRTPEITALDDVQETTTVRFTAGAFANEANITVSQVVGGQTVTVLEDSFDASITQYSFDSKGFNTGNYIVTLNNCNSRVCGDSTSIDFAIIETGLDKALVTSSYNSSLSSHRSLIRTIRLTLYRNYFTRDNAGFSRQSRTVSTYVNQLKARISELETLASQQELGTESQIGSDLAYIFTVLDSMADFLTESDRAGLEERLTALASIVETNMEAASVQELKAKIDSYKAGIENNPFAGINYNRAFLRRRLERITRRYDRIFNRRFRFSRFSDAGALGQVQRNLNNIARPMTATVRYIENSKARGRTNVFYFRFFRNLISASYSLEQAEAIYEAQLRRNPSLVNDARYQKAKENIDYFKDLINNKPY